MRGVGGLFKTQDADWSEDGDGMNMAMRMTFQRMIPGVGKIGKHQRAKRTRRGAVSLKSRDIHKMASALLKLLMSAAARTGHVQCSESNPILSLFFFIPCNSI